MRANGPVPRSLGAEGTFSENGMRALRSRNGASPTSGDGAVATL